MHKLPRPSGETCRTSEVYPATPVAAAAATRCAATTMANRIRPPSDRRPMNIDSESQYGDSQNPRVPLSGNHVSSSGLLKLDIQLLESGTLGVQAVGSRRALGPGV